ncbi:secreted repeat protein with Y-X4-D motif [Micromonospora pisi]|uniref:Secreted repeat protein with Y-X4-D motif n=1 Tax=Micromonospora pisi TaxID=589240 RepID=A0A495JBF2_9ACTN|nr:hypothetical protein [Micromonospora pisi]RKR86326.1 secreted repeat protein with Y-X4-D motif [Micromonospora pisi]
MKAVSSRVLLGPLALAAALLAAGCTSTVTDPVAVPQPEVGTVQNDLGRRSPEGGYWPRSVQLGQNPELGPVVLDGQGFTLYRFDNDSPQPPTSTCTDACAMRWPPVLVSEKITFQNLDPTALGAVNRADGTQQVTVGGWPVYRFTDDQVPGQILGQGTEGIWFAIAPDGGKAAPPGAPIGS